jgi:hypothetical protein
MYFANRTSPLRSKESLLLKDSSSLYVCFKRIYVYIYIKIYKILTCFTFLKLGNTYGIKKPTLFGQLSTFSGSCSFGFDELHGISNISKLFFDLLSSRYNTGFKYFGNELAYPFQLSNQQFDCINVAMQKSRLLIPAGVFQGSFQVVNPLNVKSLYRSLDWCQWFIYIVPLLVVPLFDDQSVRTAILALTRACALSIQWEISKAEVEEIKS